MEDFVKTLKERSNWGVLVGTILVLFVIGGVDMALGGIIYTTWVKWDEIKQFFINVQKSNKDKNA